MCGIFFALNHSGNIPDEALLVNRGPDYQNAVRINIPDTLLSVTLFSSVLHMRGASLCGQPLINSRFILQWNGEIFGGPFANLDTGSDTRILYDAILKGDRDVLDIIASVQGPFAFVLVDLERQLVYYGRDIFGRRSLLMESPNSDSGSPSGLVLRSVGGEGTEVEATGIYTYAMKTAGTSCVPWSDMGICIPRVSIDVGDGAEPYVTLQFIKMLSESIERRLVNVSDQITVLFSGGVDSLLLAALTARIAPHLRIDCVNVAFALDEHDYETVPDRITGRASFSELQSLNAGGNKLTLVTKDVPKAEFDAHKKHVMHLAHPNDSIMDESIAVALWFASRNARSRVLLAGQGADELLGGYTRHFRKMNQLGWTGFRDELQLDLDRISFRNMGRDDRVISDHGIEARFPFLDDQFVAFAASLPLCCKWNRNANKWILRDALRTLGFRPDTYNTAKRAIQFGAKSAKLQLS